jgi:class 3 adenylate cyclase/TolB-like protein/Flp pilus assembly protein TadD
LQPDRAPDQATTATDERIALELKPSGEPAAAKRRLAAILHADIRGYSRLVEADEEGTLRNLKAYRAAIDALISRHNGRVVGSAGDSVLAEFVSPVEAVRCAAEIQDELAGRNVALPPDRRLEFRIGINLGDVIVEGSELFGDGVNVAARLQALADPGGIFISGGIYDQIKTKEAFDYEFLGAQKVKNIAEPVRVYRVHCDPAAALAARIARRRRRWARNAAVMALVLAGALGVWQAIPLLTPAIERLTGAGPAVPITDRASIAVLPFANRSEREKDYFSDGLTEDIITALGRFSDLTIMSWNAVLPFKDQAVTPAQLARDLRVRYVVDGSVRRAGDRLGVTVRLSDAKGGNLLWSQRYDEAVDDVFTLQEEITRSIVRTLAIEVTNSEQERAAAKPTDNLDAYDYYLRGRQEYRKFDRRANYHAQEMFERALELDHSYADAYAALAWTHGKAAELGWTYQPDEALKRALELGQTALRLDPANVSAHVLLAVVHTYQKNFELALSELERGQELNPNASEYQTDRAWVLLLAGRSADAIQCLEDVLRSDPNPKPNAFQNLAIAYYFQGRYNDAIVTLEDAIGRHPQHLPLYIALTAVYAEAGRLDDAARVAADVRRLHPFFEADLYGEAFRDPAERDRIRSSLRKAGL